MKTLLRITLVGMALVLFSEMAFAVKVRGIKSCGDWVQDRESEKGGEVLMVRGDQNWLVGFLSGLAVGTGNEVWGKQGLNPLEENEFVWLWMDNYCRANPQKRIDDGAEALYHEQIKRK